MRIVACDATTLDIELPPCSAASPTPAYAATLSRALCATHTLVATYIAPPTPGAAAVLRLTLPAVALRRGVWSLSIETPCGCRTTSVFLDGCAPAGLVGEHLPTRDTPTPVPVSCAPALQANWLLPDPVLGFEFATATDELTRGVDAQAPVPYGSQVEPAPVLTALALTAPVGGLALVGSLAPVPDALTGRTWRLLDRYGRQQGTGVLTVVAGTATLAANLTAALGCGRYYLTVETP